jgi:hypothetical protein
MIQAVAYNKRTDSEGRLILDWCIVGEEFYLFADITGKVSDIFINPDKTATIKCFVEEEENKVRYYTVTQEGIHQVIEDV